jgi:hypothetical protein
MKSVKNSAAALKQTTSDPVWLGFKGKGQQVREIVDSQSFWSYLQLSIDFLRPFSDFIHQIEADRPDRPALGRCYAGLMELEKHVRKSMEMWMAKPELETECDATIRTWERRLNDSGGVQRILQPAHVATFLLDPLYAVENDGKLELPDVPESTRKWLRRL